MYQDLTVSVRSAKIFTIYMLVIYTELKCKIRAYGIEVKYTKNILENIFSTVWVQMVLDALSFYLKKKKILLFNINEKLAVQ